MEIIFAVVIGFILGSSKNKNIIETIKNSLGRPTDGVVELNWGGKKLFGFFSDKAAQRWYEARAHLGYGVIISLLATFKLIYLIRIDLIDSNMSRGKSYKRVLHGFQSLDKVIKKAQAISLKVEEQYNKENSENNMSYYQTFIAGHNVVGDFVNGSFV